MTDSPQKNTLRQELLKKRRSLTPDKIALFSKKIVSHLISTSFWKTAKLIGVYLSLPDEVQTQEILSLAQEQKKRIAVPNTNLSDNTLTFHIIGPNTTFQTGAFNVLEPHPPSPISSKKLDLILVPGISFDLRGHRLGYGKGFYDRLLATTPASGLGLSFEQQVIKRLPITENDIPVQGLITEKNTRLF